MPANRNPKGGKRRAKKALDISKLSKLTLTRIPRTWRAAESTAVASDFQLPAFTADKIEWKKLAGFCAIIFLVVFLLYGWSLNGSYVFNDSINYNVLATATSDNEFLATLFNRAVITPLTEPWVRLTYALDSISFPKGNIPYFHLVNIALHAVACIYLFLFVFHFVRWLKAEGRAHIDPYLAGLLAALLFACHPLATGAVSYISGRGPLLVTCNYFLCLNLFLLGFNSESLFVLICYYFLCLLFIVNGVFCGVLGITIPVSITALIFLLKPTEIRLREWLGERWMDLTVFSLCTLGLLLTLRMPRPAILDNGVDLNLLLPQAYVATEAKVLLTYFLRCFFVPAGLTPAPPMAVADGLSDPLAIAGLLVVAASVASLWWLRSNPFLFFAMLLTIFGILPNFILIQHEVVSDQRYYLSLAGLCLIVSWLVMSFLSQPKKKTSVSHADAPGLKLETPLAAIIAVLALLAGLTLWRESAWLKPETLWQQACNLNNADARATGMLAKVYLTQGLSDKAAELANQALKIDPACPPALEALGENQVTLRQYGPAQSYLQRAYDEAKKRKTAQDKLSSYTTELAEACAKNRDWSKAKLYAEEGLITRPNDPILHLALGESLLNENKPFQAMQELLKVREIDRNNPEYVEPLADAALKIGGRQYVEFAYNTAATGMHVTLSSHVNLTFVRAALELGRVQAALSRLEKILVKESRNPEALLYMSYSMHLLGKEGVAHEWEKRALALDSHIEERIKIKPVDKEAEHPTDIGRGGPTRATLAPKASQPTLAPAKPLPTGGQTQVPPSGGTANPEPAGTPAKPQPAATKSDSAGAPAKP
jgi:protein O-mannosyl-transferase